VTATPRLAESIKSKTYDSIPDPALPCAKSLSAWRFFGFVFVGWECVCFAYPFLRLLLFDWKSDFFGGD
jgi:disulfide bond formation protein DsbB